MDRLRSSTRVAQALGRTEPLALTVTGFLELPESGAYELELHCGGSCAVFLDEQLVVEGSRRVEQAFTAGVRPFRLELRGTQGLPYARLDWNRPPLFEKAQLSDGLSRVSSAPPALARRDREALLRSAWQWAATALAALLVAALAGHARHAGRRAPAALTAWWADPVHRQALATGFAALLWLASLRVWIAPRAPDGYLHAWTSEYMMQTVSVADLRDEPLRSIVFNHIQPPLFDTLRALLVAFHPGEPSAEDLVAATDRGLYACWALAFAAGTGLVGLWAARVASPAWGTLAAVAFALHPAALFYATFLDTTFVSGVLVLWMTHEIWRWSRHPEASPFRLILSVIVLFLTRSIVQFPFLVVLAAALWLRGVPARRLLRALGGIALLMTLFLAKQYALFGLLTTSSFGPDSFCKGLSAYCPGTAPVTLPRALPPPESASVLRRIEKVNGQYNYNQLAFLRRSFSQMEEYAVLVRSLSLGDVQRLLAHNLRIWSRPSSRHSAHVLVDALPWRGLLDWGLSGWRLWLLLGLAGLVWLGGAWGDSAGVRGGIGLSLPALYVFTTSIVFESGENMRYKFFLEPLIVVFLCVQGAALSRRIRAHPGRDTRGPRVALRAAEGL